MTCWIKKTNEPIHTIYFLDRGGLSGFAMMAVLIIAAYTVAIQTTN